MASPYASDNPFDDNDDIDYEYEAEWEHEEQEEMEEEEEEEEEEDIIAVFSDDEDEESTEEYDPVRPKVIRKVSPQLVTGHGARKGFAGLGRLFGNDPSNFIPPWPLWNDGFVNETSWDLSVNDLKMRSAAVTAMSSKKKINVQEPPNVDPKYVNLKDYTGRNMPKDIIVHEWKRPREINENDSNVWKLDFEIGDLDLEINNAHLFRYKSMRHIIGSFCCLERASTMYPNFPIEFLSSANYVPNTGTQWHPWQHVYANTKAGSGTHHMPKFNPYGMYFVRVYYMGAWRKITVDDYIPLNKKGEWLLPRSKDPTNLWMPLLTKALLKVAAISSTDSRPFNDFNVITALTGYLCTSVDCRDVEPDVLWAVLVNQLKPDPNRGTDEVEQPADEPDTKKSQQTTKRKSMKKERLKKQASVAVVVNEPSKDEIKQLMAEKLDKEVRKVTGGVYNNIEEDFVPLTERDKLMEEIEALKPKKVSIEEDMKNQSLIKQKSEKLNKMSPQLDDDTTKSATKVGTGGGGSDDSSEDEDDVDEDLFSLSYSSGETIESSCFSPLKEDSTPSSDLEDDEEVKQERQMKLDLADEERESENYQFCVATDSLTCLNDSKEIYAADPGSTIVLLYLHDSKKNKDIHMPYTYEGPVFAYDIESRKVPYYLPAWKMLRWLDLAKEYNVIKDIPGSTKREVIMYIPLKRRMPKKENSNADDPEDAEPKLRKATPILPTKLDFDKIVKGIWRIDIYYRQSCFKYSSYATNLTAQSSVSEWSNIPLNLGGVKLKEGVKQAPTSTNSTKVSLPSQCFYICADSFYCKSILITLSIFNPKQEFADGYLMGELYCWSNPNQGRILFSLRTIGTKTYRLNLGPGLQVVRIFFKIMFPYYIQLHSNNFYIVGNKDQMEQYTSTETISYKVIGDEMSDRFERLVMAAMNSPGLHGYALERFKSCILPFCLRRFSGPAPDITKGRLLFENALENIIMKMLFLKVPDNRISITIMRFRFIFLDEEFGQSFLNQHMPFLRDIMREIEIFKACEYADDLIYLYPRSLLNRPNLLRTLIQTKLDEAQDFQKTPPTSPRALSPNKKNKNNENKPKEIDRNLMFTSPENCIELMKSIVESDSAFGSMYPFKNDADMRSISHVFKGTSEVMPFLTWGVLARVLFNVHSVVPAPVSFQLFTTFERIVLCIYDLDSQEIMYTNYDPNYIYYLAANKLGYAAVAHGYLETQKKSIRLAHKYDSQWSIRVLVKDKEDLPHECTKLLLGRCSAKPQTEEVKLRLHALCQYYIPNSQGIIGRFAIILPKTITVTLTAKMSNENVIFAVLIFGRHNKVMAKVVGKGQAMIPALLLPRIKGHGGKEEELFYFTGRILLMYNSWDLTSEEKLHVKDLEKLGGRTTVDTNNVGGGAFWRLSMVVDASVHSTTKLVVDRTDVNIFYAILRELEVNDPGRIERGRALRAQFLRSFEELRESLFIGRGFRVNELNWMILPPKPPDSVTDVLLKKYEDPNEYILPCIYGPKAQRKIIKKSRKNTKRNQELGITKHHETVPNLKALMNEQHDMNYAIEERLWKMKEKTNKKLSDSVKDRDDFVKMQADIALRMAQYESEDKV
ncbi:hypothetical protein O3M35_004726 [Rhynocoris fuscipes]|uniref:Calpain catalytic domain-containing protein n=1 Tax=Rhynocoris fuscipes TaxID=488301 RepID=A0AAW1CIW1_9HEMI